MLHIGFAQADVTWKVGVPLIGIFGPRVMTGVHDPLLAVACVIDDGATPIALVGVDVGAVTRQTSEAARALIQRETGIPLANVLISASHTHQAAPSIETFNAVPDPDYATYVGNGIARAVIEAWNNRAAAEVGAAAGSVSGIHFNRRFLMRNGRQVTHPGKMNPDIVKPAGPVDEKINVLAARAPDGKYLGAIVHFGCHCTVTEDGHEYSADYVHYLREHLRSAIGDAPAVFLLGACGDITQVNSQSDARERGHDWAAMMGRTLGTEAAAAITRMQWMEQPRVSAKQVDLELNIREGDLCDPPALGLGSGERWENVYAREKSHVAAMRQRSATIPCAIHAIKIGEMAIVTSGAELFAQIALDIQAASAFPTTWVVTLVNEYLGYVPTAIALYAGGYEVRTARSSFLEPAAGQKIIEASLVALRELKT
jgi:hypothetical protein